MGLVKLLLKVILIPIIVLVVIAVVVFLLLKMRRDRKKKERELEKSFQPPPIQQWVPYTPNFLLGQLEGLFFDFAEDLVGTIAVEDLSVDVIEDRIIQSLHVYQ
ncbi:hypothetical protein PENCOP_c002G04962 [Penicillium coprophilum]|uniref:Uncharacterized protein n=1 Tax=Penicillium coprophilum TaxID=36646 RepID=A0A1V6V337_9EURO|nr:hypothetical protein PENCOP_c002G04962 [Penicillium coprophilum]